MPRSLQGLICAALLGALAFFYADQAWRSSECSQEPTKQDCLKSLRVSSHNVSVPVTAPRLHPPIVDNVPCNRADCGAKAHSNSQDMDESWWKWTTADPVATYTLVLCAIAIVQAGLFLWQLNYMRRSLDDTAAAAAAADKTAQAASDLNSITLEQFVADRRPWISMQIELAGPLNIFSKEKICIEINACIKNHGRAPALRVFHSLVIVPSWGAVTQEQDRLVEKIFPSEGNSGGLALFPQEDFTAEKVQVFNSDASGISFGTASSGNNKVVYTMYICGVIGYRYADARKGMTRFAFRLADVQTAAYRGAIVVGQTGVTTIKKDTLIVQRLNIGNDAE